MIATANNFLALLQRPEAAEMSTGGWVFMIGAWAAIISLAIFCFSKVLRRRKK